MNNPSNDRITRTRDFDGPLTGRRFRRNRVRALIEAGEPAFGTFLYLADPAVAELLGNAGLDFVVIDTEHTAMNLQTVENLVRAADAAGITAFVRVPEVDPAFINRVMETGAGGIMVSQVHTREDAERAVAAVKYPPKGERGMCRVTRATGYIEENFWDYAEEANRETMIIALIEDRAAAEGIKEILKVDGLDVVMPGRGDLSQSYGVGGQFEHPIVNAAAYSVIEAGSRTPGRTGGMVVFKAEEVREWIDRGALFMMFSQDSRILIGAYRAAVKTMRAAMAPEA